MAKLIKCKTCGNDIAKTAKVCPHCGAKNKHTSGCAVFIVAIVVIFAIGMAAGGGKTSSTTASAPAKTAAAESAQQGNETISRALQYLRTVDGICRVDIVGYDVFISFANNELPADYKLIVNAASMNGSRALVEAGEKPSRCSVWVIPAGQPATADNAYYSSTARKGKAE